MSFYFDKYSDKSCINQYIDYLHDGSYYNIKESVNYKFSQAKRDIDKSSLEVIESFYILTDVVCGTFENALKEVREQLKNLDWSARGIVEDSFDSTIMLDWRSDAILEQQRISKVCSVIVGSLIKDPNNKDRTGIYVAKGLEYLYKALEEGPNSVYFEYALHEFTKAKQIDGNDFFTLHKLGLIHLYSLNHIDIVASKTYFMLASTYAKDLIKKGIYNLNGQNENHNYDKVWLTKERLFEEAGSAAHYASRCNYILQNLKEAVKLANEAVNECQRNNLEYNYQRAKFYAAQGSENSASHCLRKLIRANYKYSLKILTDPDFLKNPLIVDNLKTDALACISIVEMELNQIKTKITEESIAFQLFSRIENMFSDSSYITARKVNNELYKKRKWQYIHYSQLKGSAVVTAEIKIAIASLIEIIEIENNEIEIKLVLENGAFK